MIFSSLLPLGLCVPVSFLVFWTCVTIWVYLRPLKKLGPAVVLLFAGTELDTIRSEARLPSDKVLRCVDLLSAFLTQKKVTLQELQSLLGLLNFAYFSVGLFI